MSDITNRALIAQRLSPGLADVLGMDYKTYTEWNKLVTVKKSEKAYEEVLMTAGLGLAPVKNEGSSIKISSVRDTYKSRGVHQTIALGHAITEEAIEDDLYTDIASKGASMLGNSLGQTKEIRVASLYNNAFNAAFAIGDGKALCASDHPLLDGTLDNLISADISEAALKSVWVKTGDFKDEAGLKIAVKPNMLIVTPSDYFTAVELLKSDLSTTTTTNSTTGVTNTNNINSIRSEGVFPGGMMVSHYLTDADSFFVRTDVKDSMLLFQRRPVKLKLTYEDMFTGNIVQTASERYFVLATDPRGIVGSAGV